MLQSKVKFTAMTRGMNRKQAARGFFELLVLKSWDCVDVTQGTAYGDIAISKTSKFADAVRAVATV